jgi:sugar O-acyltransferase (sialic acid O-acetyltransferase NeuD family)
MLAGMAIVVGITFTVVIQRYREAAVESMKARAAAFTAVADEAKNHTAELHHKGVFTQAELLKELEAEAVGMEQQIVALKEQKEGLLLDVVEAEKQHMLIEKKIALERETQAALDPEVGAAEVRARWLERFGAVHFATIVDPAASVSSSARVGHGAYIGTGAVVHARAVVDEGAIVNTRAVVEHDCIVEAFAHVAPAAVLCGSVRVGRGAQVSAGAVVIPARSVGAGAMVGAGAVVVRDVPAGATAVGVPARVTSTSPTR